MVDSVPDKTWLQLERAGHSNQAAQNSLQIYLLMAPAQQAMTRQL